MTGGATDGKSVGVRVGCTGSVGVRVAVAQVCVEDAGCVLSAGVTCTVTSRRIWPTALAARRTKRCVTIKHTWR